MTKLVPVPPVAVGVGAFMGIDWDTAVKIFTVIYLAILVGYTVWKWRRDVRAAAAGKVTHDE